MSAKAAEIPKSSSPEAQKPAPNVGMLKRARFDVPPSTQDSGDVSLLICKPSQCTDQLSRLIRDMIPKFPMPAMTKWINSKVALPKVVNMGVIQTGMDSS